MKLNSRHITALLDSRASVLVIVQCAAKPERAENDANAADMRAWDKHDQKARSDIILSISPSELKLIKNCETSRVMWLRLHEIFQSQGPARKATLLKRLTLHKMTDGGDVRDHLNNFFDTVDKLAEMGIEINPDLLTIMILYSLPASYENFRCAIESRDDLPTPEALRVKIVEETDARKSGSRANGSDALFANNGSARNGREYRVSANNENRKFKELRCYKCKKLGHKKSECRWKGEKQFAQNAENLCFNAIGASAFQVETGNRKWCLDSGATSHMCGDFE